MKVFPVVVAFIITLVASLTPVTASAADVKTSGLSIEPARQEITVKSGVVSKGSVKIANYTNKPLIVNLTIKQFSLLDFTFDYKFADPGQDWVKPDQQRIELQPGKNTIVRIAITPPATTPPGGHYYALFASADMSGTGFKQTAQVGSLLFLTVAGNLIRTGEISNGSVPFINTGNNITYKFDAKNTGNVHYSAFFFGQLESVFGTKSQEYGTSHMLMPGNVRTAGGSVPSPMLPGLYKFSYGYKTDINSDVNTKTAYILFIPPWSVVALVLLLYAVWKISGMLRAKRPKKQSD